MTVVLLFVALILLAVVQLVMIRVRDVPRVRLTRLSSWAKFAWVASLVLMAAGPVVVGAGVVAGLFMGSGPESEQFANSWFDLAGWVAVQGVYVLLLLGFVIAFWWPGASALLLVLTAITIPLMYAVEATVFSGPYHGQAMVEATTIPVVLVVFFSLPALLVALLLWSVSRGLDVSQEAGGLAEGGETDTRTQPDT